MQIRRSSQSFIVSIAVMICVTFCGQILPGWGGLNVCLAQLTWGPWKTVPATECTTCSLPIEIDTRCVASWGIPGGPGQPNTDCERRDGTDPLTSPTPGVTVIVSGTPVTCSHCPKCCTATPPCQCDPANPISCGSATANASPTRVGVISTRLSPPEAAIVTGSLDTCVGWGPWMSGPCSVSCPVSASLCRKVTVTVGITTEVGRECTMEHEWQRFGRWLSASPTNPCPIGGQAFITSCGSDQSKVTITLVSCPTPPYGPSTCVTVFSFCGPLCP